MRALIISGILLTAVLSGCEKSDAPPRPMPATAQAVSAERAWSEIAALGSGGGAGLFDTLATNQPEALRALNYTVVPEAWGGLLGSVSATTGGTTVELTSQGFRAVDDWITRESANRNPTELAAALDSLDHLIAGLMKSAAEQDALTLFLMAGAWRAQVLTRLAGLGEAGAPFRAGERLEKVRAVLKGSIVSKEIP